MRHHINSNVKFREDFRPFAPVTTKAASRLFFESEDEIDSPYMLLVANVRADWRERIPSVVHEDHTARVQTITPEMDLAFHTLVHRFGELTGVPMLLNTPLNRRGMPIVETPEEAIELFLKTAIDVLVIESFVVTKSANVAMVDVI